MTFSVCSGAFGGKRKWKKDPNKSLQATPVGAGLAALSHRSGVPVLDRWTVNETIKEVFCAIRYI
jgi:hypothetical protein